MPVYIIQFKSNSQRQSQISIIDSIGPVIKWLGEEKCFGRFFYQVLWWQRRYDDSDNTDDGEQEQVICLPPTNLNKKRGRMTIVTFDNAGDSHDDELGGFD